MNQIVTLKTRCISTISLYAFFEFPRVLGAYWSLINNDQENCGVTVHLVDAGIDTGNILYQDTITDSITNKDNFMSYTYLQLAKALPLLKKAIRDIESNSLKSIANTKEAINNKLFYHPTLWFYLYNRWFRGIK